MTSVDDFLRLLDEHPDDWQTMLVFADWLRERNEHFAADAWVAFAELRVYPRKHNRCLWYWYTTRAEDLSVHVLPEKLFRATAINPSLSRASWALYAHTERPTVLIVAAVQAIMSFHALGMNHDGSVRA